MQTPKSATVEELFKLLKQEGIDCCFDPFTSTFVFSRSPVYIQKHESSWSDKDIEDALDDLFLEIPDSHLKTMKITFTSEYIHHICRNGHRPFIANLVSNFYPFR